MNSERSSTKYYEFVKLIDEVLKRIKAELIKKINPKKK